MDKSYVLLKLLSGETIVGPIVPSSSKKYTTIEHPFIYDVSSVINPRGDKVKDVLTFRKYFDIFTDEPNVQFLNAGIVSKVPANGTIITIYESELQQLKTMKSLKEKIIDEVLKNAEEGTPPNSKEIFFKFDVSDPNQREQLQEFRDFLENINQDMGAMFDKMITNDMEDDVHQPNPFSAFFGSQKPSGKPNKKYKKPDLSDLKKTGQKKVSKEISDILKKRASTSPPPPPKSDSSEEE